MEEVLALQKELGSYNEEIKVNIEALNSNLKTRGTALICIDN